jgi:hypothetical protein
VTKTQLNAADTKPPVFYIATVWVGASEWEPAHRMVVRYPAVDVADYLARVRTQFGATLQVTVGPVSRSKVQG